MNWKTWYMKHAELAALKSKDSTKVGAALVGVDGEVRLTSFNGPPRGVRDLPARRERPEKYKFSAHAETNLISFAAREGIRTKGCSVFVTHHPCSACAKTLIQAGIRRVYVGPGQTSMPDDEFAAAATKIGRASCRERV